MTKMMETHVVPATPGYPQGAPLLWTWDGFAGAFVHSRGAPCGYPVGGFPLLVSFANLFIFCRICSLQLEAGASLFIRGMIGAEEVGIGATRRGQEFGQQLYWQSSQ